MKNSVSDVVVFKKIENLSLVNIPGISSGMYNSVRVMKKSLSYIVFVGYFFSGGMFSYSQGIRAGIPGENPAVSVPIVFYYAFCLQNELLRLSFRLVAGALASASPGDCV